MQIRTPNKSNIGGKVGNRVRRGLGKTHIVGLSLQSLNTDHRKFCKPTVPHTTDDRITPLKTNDALSERINLARNIHTWRKWRLEL